MVGGAFARNFRDNFDEIVCRGTSYRILTSSVQLPIILASFINPMAGGKYYPTISFLWEYYYCLILTHDVNDLGTYRIDNPSFFSLWGGPTLSLTDWEITIHILGYYGWQNWWNPCCYVTFVNFCLSWWEHSETFKLILNKIAVSQDSVRN